MNWRGYVGTVRRLPDGTVGLPGNMFSRGIGQANFGGWQACDIGKDVYRVGTVYQMESAEQRDRRVGMNPARH
jgi:hypothetical protein